MAVMTAAKSCGHSAFHNPVNAVAMFHGRYRMKVPVLALVVSAALAAPLPAHAAVKTIVLVHGAFADGSGWKPIADILVSHGYSVRVVQEPETSFLTPTWLRRGAFSTRPVLVSWSGTVMAA